MLTCGGAAVTVCSACGSSHAETTKRMEARVAQVETTRASMFIRFLSLRQPRNRTPPEGKRIALRLKQVRGLNMAELVHCNKIALSHCRGLPLRHANQNRLPACLYFIQQHFIQQRRRRGGRRLFV